MLLLIPEIPRQRPHLAAFCTAVCQVDSLNTSAVAVKAALSLASLSKRTGMALHASLPSLKAAFGQHEGAAWEEASADL